ncbi:MAG: hypothetical protein MK085_14160, partial [Phycisphaerales bacterium]|nr:hypothetical protein [Phycisphaerales bacterium]
MTGDPGTPLLTLPTGRLLRASIAGPMAVGVLWLVIGGSAFTWETGLTGLWTSAIVAGVGAAADLLIGPWRARPAISWMNLWILHSILRGGGTIGLVI